MKALARGMPARSATPAVRQNTGSRQTAEPMAAVNTVPTASSSETQREGSHSAERTTSSSEAPREESPWTPQTKTLSPIEQLRADLFGVVSRLNVGFQDMISRDRRVETSQNAMSRKIADMECRLNSIVSSMKELLAIEDLRHRQMEETYRSVAPIAEWAREVMAREEHPPSSTTR